MGTRKTFLRLYNQAKNLHEMTQQARMSFVDIEVILNKVVEEKKTEVEEKIKQLKYNYKDYR